MLIRRTSTFQSSAVRGTLGSRAEYQARRHAGRRPLPPRLVERRGSIRRSFAGGQATEGRRTSPSTRCAGGRAEPPNCSGRSSPSTNAAGDRRCGDIIIADTKFNSGVCRRHGSLIDDCSRRIVALAQGELRARARPAITDVNRSGTTCSRWSTAASGTSGPGADPAGYRASIALRTFRQLTGYALGLTRSGAAPPERR